MLKQIQYPLTQGDTPGQTQPPTVNYTYTNDYYLYSSQDEGGHTTIFKRDANHRIYEIDYPDGGYETFSYNPFGGVLSHRLKTGGTETFTYNPRWLKQTYRNPSNPTGNPTAQYQYDAFDRVLGVTDALGSTSGDVNHTTSFAYNARGQLTTTTHPNDPIDGQQHTIINGYNSDGTLASKTDELSHVSQFTYDQYKRLRTAKTPDRFTGDTTPHTTSTFYDANGTADDYTHTDANPTYITLPGGERSQTTYDENYRKTSVTTAFGTTDAATTSFGYDNVGNVTSVKSPKEQPGQPYASKSTITAYDERNRVMSVTDARAGATSYTYDVAGHKASITRPNGQVTTYDAYDAMNRLLQQTVKQTPDPNAVTKFTYDSTGSDLFYTMQDPRLFAVASPEKYTFNFDQMGRKTSTVYPPAVNGGASTSESFTYDVAGRLYKFTNRNGKVQTFTYDRLNRPTNVAWNDSGLTPTVTFTYDVAMRVKSINNTNATISRVYFNDNLLNTETTTYPGADNTARTVIYTYDADARRATLQYPNNAFSFTYNYSNRSQLWKISNTSGGAVLVTNLYDLDGNLATRTPNNSTSSTYTYDVLDRVINISLALVTGNRTLDYAYDSVSNRKWTKRDGAKGDVFGYDLNDQSTSMLRDILNPDTTAPGPQTINYDANGNRTSFAAYAPTATYVPNNLSQYASRNSVSAGYDTKGNLTNGFDGSVYTYDAQNRLLSAAKGSVSYTFKYDALNRQISRTVSGATTYNVYDGWDLIAEYAAHATLPSTAYLAGAGGLVKNLTTNRYYYQDASGSTSHLASSTGALLEWYRYDLQGTPVFYDPTNTQRTSSAYSEGHLFTGQQWYRELGLYDLRNRFYSPDIGRFLQPDPIGFNGDATNLYRYCGNNPLKWYDPMGTQGYPVGDCPFPPVSGGQFVIPPGLGSAPPAGFTYGNYDQNVVNMQQAGSTLLAVGAAGSIAIVAGPSIVSAGGYTMELAIGSGLVLLEAYASAPEPVREQINQGVEHVIQELHDASMNYITTDQGSGGGTSDASWGSDGSTYYSGLTPTPGGVTIGEGFHGYDPGEARPGGHMVHFKPVTDFGAWRGPLVEWNFAGGASHASKLAAFRQWMNWQRQQQPFSFFQPSQDPSAPIVTHAARTLGK